MAYHPAYEVGGDFYDWITPAPERFVCIVGDVAGKGVSAALLTPWITSEFSNAAAREPSPALVLEALNRRMIALGQQDAFVTALCLDIDLERQRATLANAGHVPPVRVRSPGDLDEIGRPSGVPLGIVGGERYQDEPCELGGGQLLLLATDGVTEALSGSARFSGPKLRELAGPGDPDPHELAPRLAAAAIRESPDGHLDDVTVVALKLPREA